MRLRAEPHRLAALAAALAGGVVATQQRLNGGLGVRLDDALVAALLSLAGAFVLSTLVIAANPASRRAARSLAHTPPWQLLGGIGGASMVCIAAVATPHIGVALLTVGTVAGRTSGGVLIDRFGLGAGSRRAVTGPRLAGAVLCLVAVAVGLIGRDSQHAGVALVSLAVGAGLLSSGQWALNGRLRQRTGSALVAANVNFAVGGMVVALAITVSAAMTQWPVLHWPDGGHWYLFLGGPLGVLVVWTASRTVRSLGVLRLGLATTAGQLVGSLALDVLAPAPGTSIAATTVIGAALTVIAAAVTGLRAHGTVPMRLDAQRTQA